LEKLRTLATSEEVYLGINVVLSELYPVGYNLGRMDSLTEMGILSTFQSQVEPSAFFCGRTKRPKMKKVRLVYLEIHLESGEVYKPSRNNPVL
jgi:hypothetical protein